MFLKPQQTLVSASKPIINSPQQARGSGSQHVVSKASTNPRKAIEEFSYGMGDQIGKGFSSKVFKGRNDQTGEVVAIKVIEMQLLKTPLHHALLRSEIESLQSLDNINVIKLHKVLQTQNNTYLMTDYCEGGDLGSRLTNEHRIHEASVADIMIGVVKGYKVLKQQGIVHRDLKPANILMKGGLPKIADFGFATTPRSRPTMPNVNVGSPLYMSPQALRQNKYSEKSDIWALGATTYELLFGQVPWQACSEKELGQKMLTVPVAFPVGVHISEDCKSFIRCCLVVDEAKRVCIEELDKHQWLRKRWVQTRAQESAKKALNAPIVQVKQLSHCKPMKDKENSPNSTDVTVLKRQVSQNAQSYVQPFMNNNVEIKRQVTHGKKSMDFQNNSISFIENNCKSTNKYFEDQKSDREVSLPISNLNKKQTKLNDFIILAQLNFCRYLFRVAQLIEKGALFVARFEKEKILFVLFKHLLIKMKRLKKVAESPASDPFQLVSFNEYITQESFQQLSQAISQYEQKYLLQFATYWLTMFQNGDVKRALTEQLGESFSNDFSENLEFEESVQEHLKEAIKNTTLELDKWLVSVGDEALVPIEVEPSLVLLDYLVTYLQLVTMFGWNEWENFAKMSRIEQIAQGKPVRLTMAHYLEIKRKINEILH